MVSYIEAIEKKQSEKFAFLFFHLEVPLKFNPVLVLSMTTFSQLNMTCLT